MKVNIKKILSLILAVLMVVGLMPVGVITAGATDPEEDGLTEDTAFIVRDFDDLKAKLKDPSITYLWVAIEDECTVNITEKIDLGGILEVVGKKDLYVVYDLTVKAAGERVRSLFYIDEGDDLTIKNGTIKYYSNHEYDGAVVWGVGGKLTLNGAYLYGYVNGNNAYSCYAVYNAGATMNLISGTLYGTAGSDIPSSVWGSVFADSYGTTVLGGSDSAVSPLRISGNYENAISYKGKLSGLSIWGSAAQNVRIKENVIIEQFRDFSVHVQVVAGQKVCDIIADDCSVYNESKTAMLGTNVASIKETIHVVKPVGTVVVDLTGYKAGSSVDEDGKVSGMSVNAYGNVEIDSVWISKANTYDDEYMLASDYLHSGTTYWLVVYVTPKSSYDMSFLNEEMIQLTGVTAVDEQLEHTKYDQYFAIFELPKLKDTVVDKFTFDLSGYERGAKAGDVQVSQPTGIVIDNDITKLSTDSNGNSLLSGSYPLNTNEDYYFQVVFSAAAGYDISDLSPEKVHLNGVTSTSITTSYKSGVGTIIFGLPKIPREPITSIDFTINGYGSGKTPADVVITEANEKVTVDDIVFSTNEAGTSVISSATQFYNNMDIWVSFTVYAAEGKSVAALTDKLISVSGVSADIVSIEYNATFDYLDVKLKLAKIPTPPNVDLDISGYVANAQIADVSTELGEYAENIDIYAVGIYSDPSCDSEYELTTGNFVGETDYWMEILVVSDSPMDMITDSVVHIDGVEYTDMVVEYNAKYDWLSIKLHLKQLFGNSFDFDIQGYDVGATIEDIEVTEQYGNEKAEINYIYLHTSLEDAKKCENSVDGAIAVNTDYWLTINLIENGALSLEDVLASAINLTGVSGAEVEGIYYDNRSDLWDVIVKLPRFVDESRTLEFDIDGYVQDGAASSVDAIEKNGTDKITVNEVTLYTSLEDAKNYENIVEGNILANTDYWMAINIYATDDFDISAVLATAITLTGIGGAEVEGIYYDNRSDLWDVIVKLPRFVDESKTLEFDIDGYVQDGAASSVDAIEKNGTNKITIEGVTLHTSLEDAKNCENIVEGNILANTDYWLAINIYATDDFDISAVLTHAVTLNGVVGATVEEIYYDDFADIWSVIIKLPEFYAYVPGYSVSGTVTSFGDDEENVTIELFKEGESEAAYSVSVVGTVESAAAFIIEGVEAGTYIMKVSKSKHATREYVIEVVDADVEQMCKIHLYGDVTGDGSIDSSDAMQILRFAASKTSLLAGSDEAENAYLFKVANIVTTDGDQLNSSDAMQIFRYFAEKASALDSIA